MNYRLKPREVLAYQFQYAFLSKAPQWFQDLITKRWIVVWDNSWSKPPRPYFVIHYPTGSQHVLGKGDWVVKDGEDVIGVPKELFNSLYEPNTES